MSSLIKPGSRGDMSIYQRWITTLNKDCKLYNYEELKANYRNKFNLEELKANNRDKLNLKIGNRGLVEQGLQKRLKRNHS